MSEYLLFAEHVVNINCSECQNQFLYTTCSPHVLQKEELLTKIYLYRHKETFKDKNETFEHLEKSHKETGRRCHHCFDFFSFDIDAMKNHIHENHSEGYKMTRGNVKNVKKRTAKIQKNGKLKCDRCKVSTITSAVTLEKHYYRY